VTVLLVALGAAVGAPMRYLIDRAVQARHSSPLPWGTFMVNMVGSLLLGLLATASLHTPAPVLAAAGTGLCGALTTYSTFGYETVQLVQRGAGLSALINVAASVIVGLGAAGLGAALAHGLAT